MLKRPKHIIQAQPDNSLLLRGKFNSILEERLGDGYDDRHHIMSIEVPLDEFTLLGNLTVPGKISFWKEVDCALKKFDADKITLKPRKFQPTASKAKSTTTQHRHKLPTPPPTTQQHGGEKRYRLRPRS